MTWNPTEKAPGLPQFAAYPFPRDQVNYFAQLEAALATTNQRLVESQTLLLQKAEELDKLRTDWDKRLTALEQAP